jgi:hypothetical protein
MGFRMGLHWNEESVSESGRERGICWGKEDDRETQTERERGREKKFIKN